MKLFLLSFMIVLLMGCNTKKEAPYIPTPEEIIALRQSDSLKKIKDSIAHLNLARKRKLKNSYSGTYEIKTRGYKGDGNEALYLDATGKAVYIWATMKRGVATSVDKKTGTWDAEKDIITVKINGTSGVIPLNYARINGKWIDTENVKNYLKKSL